MIKRETKTSRERWGIGEGKGRRKWACDRVKERSIQRG